MPYRQVQGFSRFVRGAFCAARLVIWPGYRHRREEASLIAHIDAATLTPFRFQWTGKRLTGSFGRNYDLQTGILSPADPLPAWLDAAHFPGMDAQKLEQALAIRYDAGAGIGGHRDRSVFEHVIGISLGAPAVMWIGKIIFTSP